MEFVKKEYKNLIIIFVVFVITALIFQNKTFTLYIDFGREAFFPKSILDGEILYKDIFNVFGPFSYLWNALMYKIFGIKLSTLYLAGCLNALSIVFAFYYILRNFFDEKLSLILNLFAIEFCIFTTSLMNFVTPYSYAIVYGFNFFLISICFYLAFLNGKREKIKYLYGAFLFAGLAISNKYEFILYFLLLFFSLFRDKISLKHSVALILTTAMPVCLLFLILVNQGLMLNDFTTYLHFFAKYIKSPGLNDFYSGIVWFTPGSFSISVISFSIQLILISIIYFSLSGLQKQKPILRNILLALIGLIYFGIFYYFDNLFARLQFAHMALLAFILYALKVRKVYSEPKKFFVITAVILISFKVFWFVYTTHGYGHYFLPMLLLAVILLVQDFYISEISKKAIFNQTVKFFLLILLVTSLYFDFMNVNKVNFKIDTPKGIIYAEKYEAAEFQFLVNWIRENTKPSDKILVLPETSLLNFLLDRKSDNNFNVLKVEGVETYGEEYIIKHFQSSPPDYFVIIGAKYAEKRFSIDYAKVLSKWISDNYKQVFKLRGSDVMVVYEKK